GKRKAGSAEESGKRERKFEIASRLEGKLFAVDIGMGADWRSKDPDITPIGILENYKAVAIELAPYGFETQRSQIAKDPGQNNRRSPRDSQQWQRLGIGAEQEGRVRSRPPP